MADISVNLQGKDNLSKTVESAAHAVDDLKKSTTELGKAEKEFEKITNGGKSLKTELRQIQALMAKMNLKGLSGTEEFTEMALRAGQLKDAIADAAQATKNYSSDTANLDAAMSAMQGVAGAATVLTGAMSLFGAENEEVANAILKVQSALSILNGVQAIANTLNKDSALMLKLKQVLMITNTASTTANTVAEGANTAALGTNAAAKTANAAATATATGAQISFNAAVLANPYVLAAAAIAALVAGIVIYANTVDDATDSQIAMNAAVDAFNEVADTHMNKAAEQIQLYDKLKKEYDESGKKVDEFAKKLIANTTVQKKLGITVKTVDDVHRVFANNTKTYAAAATARATAMAAEAAKATLLGKTLAQLSQIYAKLRAGQEVNWRDIQDIYESVGYSAEQAEKKMKEAGYHKFSDSSFFGGFADALGGNLQKTIEHMINSPVMHELSKTVEKELSKVGKANSINFNGLLNDNLDGLSDSAEKTSKASGKTAKSTGQTSKNVKETKEEIRKTLTTLEGCEAIIQEADKQMKKLDKTSKTYNEDLKKLKDTKLTAQVAKLDLIDRSTLDGLMEARSLVKDIIKDSPEGSPQLANMQNVLTDINEEMYEFYQKAAAKGDIKNMKEAASAIRMIADEAPIGSEQWKIWIERWIKINEQVDKATRVIDNMIRGIEKDSIAELQQQLSDIEKELQNKNLSIEVRADLNDRADYLKERIAELTSGEPTISVPVQTYFVKGSNEDLRRSYQNAQTLINRYLEDINSGLIDKSEAKRHIQILNEQLQELGLKPIEVHIQTNFDKFKQDFEDALSGVDSITNAVDSIQSLSEALEEGADAWDIFKKGTETARAVMDGINTVIQFSQWVMGLLTAQKTASAAADSAAASATTAEGAAEAASIPAKTAATVANKALESSVLDLAAAQIFAAHAAIPFAGTGIASGMISAMMAAMTAQHAASAALQTFADGGIVKGAFSHGDRMLVRANAGEMIINPRQQANLFKIINDGISGNDTVSEVQWRIKGSDLYGTLKNYTKIKSKSSSISAL